jgi:calcium-dependent protein kinase
MDILSQKFDLLFKKRMFINSNKEDIRKLYSYNPKQAIGSGSFGKVFKATCKLTGVHRAIKQIDKSLISNVKQFEVETNILKELDHPNVIKMYETFEDADYVYLVMELCEGGELFYLVESKGNLYIMSFLF